MKEYKEINGVSFDARTNEKVCNIISRYCGNRGARLRLFYGDTETGKDWREVWDTVGYIGRSTGRVKIPLLIARADSIGGRAILDHCIVKITLGKVTIYQHPKYYCPIELKGTDIHDSETGEIIFHCDSEKAARNEYNFFMGLTNRHIYK